MSKQTLWEGMINGKASAMVHKDGIVTIEPLHEGILSNIATGMWNFSKAHPIMTSIAAGAAYDAWKAYRTKIEKSVKFEAKDQAERKNMQKVIDQMVKNGYKLVKQSYKGANGYEWHLERK